MTEQIKDKQFDGQRDGERLLFVFRRHIIAMRKGFYLLLGSMTLGSLPFLIWQDNLNLFMGVCWWIYFWFDALFLSFLMWFYAQYGRDAVIHIAFDVLDGGNDPDVWYEETGNSIHVLWLLYCRDSGFGQHELENVYWMQTAAAVGNGHLDSPVILISQRTGIQPSI